MGKSKNEFLYEGHGLNFHHKSEKLMAEVNRAVGRFDLSIPTVDGVAELKKKLGSLYSSYKALLEKYASGGLTSTLIKTESAKDKLTDLVDKKKRLEADYQARLQRCYDQIQCSFQKLNLSSSTKAAASATTIHRKISVDLETAEEETEALLQRNRDHDEEGTQILNEEAEVESQGQLKIQQANQILAESSSSEASSRRPSSSSEVPSSSPSNLHNHISATESAETSSEASFHVVTSSDSGLIKIDDYTSFDPNRYLGGKESGVYFGQFTIKANKTIPVAVKLFRRSKHNEEASNLLELHHPNVIRFYWCEEYKHPEHDFYEVMELCQRSLDDIMKEHPVYCRQNCREIFLAIGRGLKHIHDADIVHCEVNPSNVMQTQDGRFVLANFGFSRKCGDPHKLSPRSESDHEEKEASAMGDLHSAGAILFWLITEGKYDFDSLQRRGKTQLHLIDLSFHHDNELAKDLIGGLLENDPKKRMRYDDAVQHAFFWDDHKKRNFIQRLYTRVEILPNDDCGGPLTVKQRLNKQAEHITGKNWSEELMITDAEVECCCANSQSVSRDSLIGFKLGETVWTRKNEPKPYDFSSPFSLLRLIRNLFTHEYSSNENTKIVMKIVGLWKFILSRFPKFFLHVWKNTMDEALNELRSEFTDKSEQRISVPQDEHKIWI